MLTWMGEEDFDVQRYYLLLLRNMQSDLIGLLLLWRLFTLIGEDFLLYAL